MKKNLYFSLTFIGQDLFQIELIVFFLCTVDTTLGEMPEDLHERNRSKEECVAGVYKHGGKFASGEKHAFHG